MMCYASPASLSHSLFFYNATATTEIYTLSLHDALPIYLHHETSEHGGVGQQIRDSPFANIRDSGTDCNHSRNHGRSEEHTSELQSLRHLVCRLLLEKKKKKNK